MFCDHWKSVSGHDPKMLIMDPKVTTQAVLGELDTRGVKFATLRMRAAKLVPFAWTLRLFAPSAARDALGVQSSACWFAQVRRFCGQCPWLSVRRAA